MSRNGELLVVSTRFFRTGVSPVILASLFSASVVTPAVADGITWTPQTAASNFAWQSIAYGNGVFVAVNPENSPRAMSSANGTSWAPGTNFAQQGYQSVVYGNGLFVAVNNTGPQTRFMTSVNGTSWTVSNDSVTPGGNWSSVTYGTVGGSGAFVAVGASGAVMTSTNGTVWTLRTTGINSNWNAVTYGDGVFVAVGASGAVMTSINNGETWTARTAAANNWESVTYGDGLFVAVSSSGADRVMTSANGITWTARTAAEANNWNSVTYGDGLFVAVSSSGTNRVMTSPNGITWTARTAAAPNNWESVAYGTVAGSGVFVAVSSNGTNRVMTSPVTAPAFTLSSSTESRTVGTAATGFTTTSTGGPFTRFTIDATPPGMSFNTTTGALTGTPNTVASATTYTVTATNSAGSATQTFTITVNSTLVAQTITFPAINDAVVGSTTTSANATTSSGINVLYRSNSNSVCTIFEGYWNTPGPMPITLLTVGTCSITASEEGDATYAPAADVTRTFNVTAAPVVADNSAALAEAARKAKEQKELTEILALIPKIGELTLSLGETTKSLYSTKCVKGKTTKFVKKGAKCPKGYVKKK